MIRTYKDLRTLETFEERFEYLKLGGNVGRETFGFDRYMNQRFYTSPQWKRVRNIVINRDNGCDLGVPGYEIFDKVYIHHINPMRRDDLIHGSEDILDPEFLITTTHETHNAIHYGSADRLTKVYTERQAGDTKLW